MKPPYPNDVLVGANIRMHRNAARMSQMDMGKHLDVTFQQVQKYEKGTNRVGAGKLLIIANLLKLPVTAFYDGAKVTASGNTPVQLLGRRDALRLAEGFEKIADQRVRNALVALVVGLTEPDKKPPQKKRRRP
jgi:transcriptional regulator with XRE-family HTH domain